MEYRRLGKAGLKVSELSFGSWITFGSNLSLNNIRQCLNVAFEAGVNFFDNAEVYANGASELLMGEAIKDFRREDLVISTKIFWGGKGPNATGLSWKHLVEGTKGSLRRLQLDYVDLLFCHRPDPTTPIEETVRAMDFLVRSGLAFYWGTSEWSAEDIKEAYQIAHAIHAIPPSMEQPEYNLFHRTRVEQEYAPLYHKYGMGTTIWSPLESGILTGKYNEEIPPASRLSRHEELRHRLTKEKICKVKALEKLAHELSCSLPQLAIAWCLKNPHVSSVILGASSLPQLQENLKAEQVKQQLTDEVIHSIEEILKNPISQI
ncbi:aldo/keto reductase [Parachlamydia sp. AcF125]|uniref:potassium channel beta subunit family protein n=1 Tax=Parachlamydia sp. AcF125 TaxID=2795736 RepID=UPI001BC97C8A|nr:aldo/keto reductase [Parachlamydia sp. AcF125]MBS4168756.1 L-glyceraldehyde 3-phosphate reductase [Parachlamydia sp. AcF125]